MSLPLRRMTAGDADVTTALDWLREALGRPGGWDPEIGTRARAAAERLAEWRVKNEIRPYTALRNALGALKEARPTWDDAAQCYLALIAWQRSRPATDPAFGTKLLALRRQLQQLLPRSPERFDTPRGYRPDEVTPLLRELSGLLKAE